MHLHNKSEDIKWSLSYVLAAESQGFRPLNGIQASWNYLKDPSKDNWVWKICADHK